MIGLAEACKSMTCANSPAPKIGEHVPQRRFEGPRVGVSLRTPTPARIKGCGVGVYFVQPQLMPARQDFRTFGCGRGFSPDACEQESIGAEAPPTKAWQSENPRRRATWEVRRPRQWAHRNAPGSPRQMRRAKACPSRTGDSAPSSGASSATPGGSSTITVEP